MMFELEVRRIFSAAHALLLRGEREVLHGHDWQVDLTIAASSLDADELAFDFHQLERILDSVLQPFQSANLNATPPFDRVNPSAEAVACYVAQEVARHLPKGVRVHAVRVTEAPGCAARFIPSAEEAACS
jgi:6-pyruvoyltetrahydropterin/6-carboxytetrahydropterin synthase